MEMKNSTTVRQCEQVPISTGLKEKVHTHQRKSKPTPFLGLALLTKQSAFILGMTSSLKTVQPTPMIISASGQPLPPLLYLEGVMRYLHR